MGTIDVFAPVNPVSTAIAISMPADARYTITETGSGNPTDLVIDSVSAPMKHIARPSATHSILMMRLLSSDIAPKPWTTDLVGTIWAMPHMRIIIDAA